LRFRRLLLQVVVEAAREQPEAAVAGQQPLDLQAEPEAVHLPATEPELLPEPARPPEPPQQREERSSQRPQGVRLEQLQSKFRPSRFAYRTSGTA
jgi:hypothetical protein